MKRTFTDFSQLSKTIFATAPKENEAKPAPPKARLHGGEDVLAYFARPATGASAGRVGPEQAPAQDGTDSQTEALRAQLRDSEAARSEAAATCVRLEGVREKLAAALAAAEKEIARLRGECGRLQGEARKAAEEASAAPVEKGSPAAVQLPAAARPTRGILAAPAVFDEAFPGELREMVLSALSDARDTARQGTRERRAAVLDAVLAVNRPTGELERRRTALKQAMKDAGYYTDPHALESLGFRLISGHTHWKLEYAGVRLPIAKTPSDYRANLNMATDMANRCF